MDRKCRSYYYIGGDLVRPQELSLLKSIPSSKMHFSQRREMPYMSDTP